MVKGKIGSKAAEKKKERIAMQRKMDARLVFVNAANQQVDPLATLPSFKVNFYLIFFWNLPFLTLYLLLAEVH